MLRGILAAMATPFDETGARIDEGALRELVNGLIARRIHGLVVEGSTGEFFLQTVAERKRVLEITLEEVRGRVPVIAHTGAVSTPDAVDLARHAEQAGARALMIVPPYYEPLTRRELFAHFEAIGQATSLPIMLYNIPACSGHDVTPDLVVELARTANIAYVKDSTGDMKRIHELTFLSHGQITPINGADTMTYQAFSYGTTAAVWGAANAIPREAAALYTLMVEKKDMATAQQLWRTLLPINRFFETRGYIASVKAATEMTGLRVGPPRRPLLPLAPEDRQELAGLMAGLQDVAAIVDSALA